LRDLLGRVWTAVRGGDASSVELPAIVGTSILRQAILRAAHRPSGQRWSLLPSCYCEAAA
jgi:hypothetical protein